MSIKHFGSRHFAAKEFLAITGGVSAVSPSVPAVPSTPVTFAFVSPEDEALLDAVIAQRNAPDNDTVPPYFAAREKRESWATIEPFDVQMTLTRDVERELQVAGIIAPPGAGTYFLIGLGVGAAGLLLYLRSRE